jgi:alpha-N-arabinofuranosidase
MRSNSIISLLTAALACLALPASAQTAPPVALQIHVDQIRAQASPTLYGLMTEEVNHSYDGGLYAELIANRAAHANDSWRKDIDPIDHWSIVERGTSKASFTPDETTGPSAALPYSLKLTVENVFASDPAGVANTGYWGIPVRPATTYQGSFYAKSNDQSTSIHVALVNDNTGVEAAHADVPALTTAWKQYRFTLTTGAEPASSLYRLEITTNRSGTLWLSLVSLFPPTYNDRPNGNRIDLMEKLAAMHPTFLRFPGGNYLEGDTIPTRFNWKQTIGPLVDRPSYLGTWQYRSTNGMGILEFLEWCQDLRMQPVLAVYAGYSLHGQHVDAGPGLVPYINDALDEIEYVTGDASTKWGAKRAADGHPQPFELKYIEIGNEDAFDESHSYNGRFTQFFKTIKAHYPNLQLIATAPVTSVQPDVLDEHYYRSAQAFYDDVHHYDKTSRSGPKIFVGEYATLQGEPTGNFGAALGDAAWMTGLERNSDLVILSSYAPLLTNINPQAMQWTPNLIGYNALTSYGSPSYYVQAMFGQFHGDEIPEAQQIGDSAKFFYSVTRQSQTGELYLKLVNASSAPQPVNILIDGAKSVDATANSVTLSAKTLAATNSIDQPENITPVESTFDQASGNFTYTLPSYSIQVLRLKTK